MVHSCDLECHSDCFDIKKYVSFGVVLQCARHRCNCWYKVSEPIASQLNASANSTATTCNQECAFSCIESLKTSEEVFNCVETLCGCVQPNKEQPEVTPTEEAEPVEPTAEVEPAAEPTTLY